MKVNLFDKEMLKYSEFIAQYANLPLDKRKVVLDFERFERQTISDICYEIQKARAEILGRKANLESLLAIAEEFLPKLKI